MLRSALFVQRLSVSQPLQHGIPTLRRTFSSFPHISRSKEIDAPLLRRLRISAGELIGEGSSNGGSEVNRMRKKKAVLDTSMLSASAAAVSMSVNEGDRSGVKKKVISREISKVSTLLHGAKSEYHGLFKDVEKGRREAFHRAKKAERTLEVLTMISWLIKESETSWVDLENFRDRLDDCILFPKEISTRRGEARDEVFAAMASSSSSSSQLAALLDDPASFMSSISSSSSPSASSSASSDGQLNSFSWAAEELWRPTVFWNQSYFEDVYGKGSRNAKAEADAVRAIRAGVEQSSFDNADGSADAANASAESSDGGVTSSSSSSSSSSSAEASASRRALVNVFGSDAATRSGKAAGISALAYEAAPTAAETLAARVSEAELAVASELSRLEESNMHLVRLIYKVWSIPRAPFNLLPAAVRSAAIDFVESEHGMRVRKAFRERSSAAKSAAAKTPKKVGDPYGVRTTEEDVSLLAEIVAGDETAKAEAEKSDVLRELFSLGAAAPLLAVAPDSSLLTVEESGRTASALLGLSAPPMGDFAFNENEAGEETVTSLDGTEDPRELADDLVSSHTASGKGRLREHRGAYSRTRLTLGARIRESLHRYKDASAVLAWLRRDLELMTGEKISTSPSSNTTTTSSAAEARADGNDIATEAESEGATKRLARIGRALDALCAEDPAGAKHVLSSPAVFGAAFGIPEFDVRVVRRLIEAVRKTRGEAIIEGRQVTPEEVYTAMAAEAAEIAEEGKK